MSFSCLPYVHTHIINQLPNSLHLHAFLVCACDRSLVNYNLQDYDSALSDADKSLTLDPKWMKGFYRRGLALSALNRNAEAQAAYEEALKQFRQNGNIAFAGKNMVDAKKSYSEALAIAVKHGLNDSAHECHKIYTNR